MPDYESARAALEQWQASNYEGEPDGWIRARTRDKRGVFYERRVLTEPLYVTSAKVKFRV